MQKLDVQDILFQLIIVDNNSTDDTATVIAEFAERAPFPVVSLKETKRGLSNARNCGIRAATGSVILFTDDDCYPHPDWVRAAAKLFEDRTDKVVGGRVELFNKSHLAMCIKTSMDRDVLVSATNMFGFLHGANLAFGRCVLDSIGGFDVRIGAGSRLSSGEDIDFAYRAMIAGIPVTYEPSLVVDHDHGRITPKVGEKQHYGYGLGTGAVAAKFFLQGRTDILKAVCWNIRGTIRAWRRGRCTFQRMVGQIALLHGAVLFMLSASWKKSGVMPGA